MGWLKKGNLVATALALLLLFLFVALFLDPWLKWALIRAGQIAAGAKVEIAAVDLSLLRGRLSIESFAAANKSEPMKNLLEFERAVFQLDPSAGLRGKIVIPEASLSGLRFSTERKTSGALPASRRPPSFIEKAVQKEFSTLKESAIGNIGKAKNVAVELDPRQLASLKSLEESDSKLSQTADRWKERLQASKIEGEIRQVQTRIQELQKGGNSPAEIARKVELTRQTQERIRSLLAEVQSSKKALDEEFDLIRGGIQKAQDLKNKDLGQLLSAAGLPSLDPESLTRRLLGPAAYQKLSTALYWIDWARKKNASPASRASQKPPRRRGVNFEFPLEKTFPDFLLAKASLSGTLNSLFQGQDMRLEGTVSGATSNPPLYGKPLKISLRASSSGGGPSMGLEGLLDQTRPGGPTELSFSYKGLSLAGATLGDSELGAAVKKGVADLNGTIRVAGEDWKGQVLIQARAVSLQPRLKLEGQANRYAAAALGSVDRFSARVGFAGKPDDLSFSLSSDLGSAVAQGLQRAFSDELAAQRKALEAKLSALYAPKAQALAQRSKELESRLLAPLNKQQDALERALKDAASKALGRSIQLPKLFR
ncbi:MAG: TIGR03545 family protein [Elusimicrobia bacterium]|nr:TIGR03545 family protein [Elusimicrobiota bacterium]